jgi:hypothetical protein
MSHGKCQCHILSQEQNDNWTGISGILFLLHLTPLVAVNFRVAVAFLVHAPWLTRCCSMKASGDNVPVTPSAAAASSTERGGSAAANAGERYPRHTPKKQRV